VKACIKVKIATSFDEVDRGGTQKYKIKLSKQLICHFLCEWFDEAFTSHSVVKSGTAFFPFLCRFRMK